MQTAESTTARILCLNRHPIGKKIQDSADIHSKTASMLLAVLYFSKTSPQTVY